MDEDQATETTGFLSEEEGKKDTDITITRRFRIQNDNGEHSLHSVVVIEDSRAGFYISFIAIILLGILLTKAFTKEDYTAVLKQVYGISNLCSYFDYPPSTYVLPALWCFPVVIASFHSAQAVLRINIAYLENKLSRFAHVTLIVVHVYMILSVICFAIIFAVQPDPAKPKTMLIHTIPYVNLKIMFAVFQVAVVYFGVKVSWVGLNLPHWFHITSIVHAVLLVPVSIFGVIWIINALGDMGEKNLEGKGLWWSVRADASKMSGQVITNALSFFLSLILPLLQALFICRKGVKSHALIVAVTDNRVCA